MIHIMMGMIRCAEPDDLDIDPIGPMSITARAPREDPGKVWVRNRKRPGNIEDSAR